MEEVKYKFASYNISQLEGEVLTLVDASFQDPEQRKAFKDIIRQMIWGWAIRNNLDGRGDGECKG